MYSIVSRFLVKSTSLKATPKRNQMPQTDIQSKLPIIFKWELPQKRAFHIFRRAPTSHSLIIAQEGLYYGSRLIPWSIIIVVHCRFECLIGIKVREIDHLRKLYMSSKIPCGIPPTVDRNAILENIQKMCYELPPVKGYRYVY